MKKPSVSVLVAMFRPSGLDITLAGMRDQTLPKWEFEVVIVDRRWEHRHAQVLALADRYGIHCFHVPEHRRNGKWQGIASAWNTALAVARGDVVIFLQDFAYAPAGWIQAHLHWHTPGSFRYILGPYTYYGLPELRLLPPYASAGYAFGGDRLRSTIQDPVLRGGILDEVAGFSAGDFDPAWIESLPRLDSPQDPRSANVGDEVPDTWPHLKNESIRRELAYSLNGLDERLDRGKGPIDLDWGLRLSAAGVKILWDPATHTPAINSRAIVATMPWGTMNERLEGRWSWQDGLAYNDRRRAECVSGPPTAKNPFRLRTLALALEEWRHDPPIDVKGLDIPDFIYWGPEPIWSDTPYEGTRRPPPHVVEPPPPPVAASGDVLAPWQSWGPGPPPGGSGPVCPECGLSTFVEIGGGDNPDSFHPNLDILDHPNVDIRCDLESGEFPLHSNHADRAKANHIIEHISRDATRRIFREVWRILKPGGHFSLLVSDLAFVLDRIREDGPIEPWLSCLYHAPAATNHGWHKWAYTFESLCEELRDAGFVAVKHGGYWNRWEFHATCEKPT